MRISNRMFPLALAVVVLGASVAPCALGVGTAGASQLRIAAGAAAHPPDCHRAAAPELAAPCPCGCSDDGAAVSGARLGFALPAVARVRATLLQVRPDGSPFERTTDAPVLGIDHVPLVG